MAVTGVDKQGRNAILAAVQQIGQCPFYPADAVGFEVAGQHAVRQVDDKSQWRCVSGSR